MKRAVIVALFSSLPVAALAQTSPAQMGITPATVPEVLQVLDNTKTWVTIGNVNPATHTFTPIGGGSSSGAGNCDVLTNACTYLNVLDYGFKPGGVFDNSPQVANLMAAFPSSQSSNMDVLFPTIPGQIYTDYYFSQTFVISRHMHIRCGGQVTGGDASTRLIFPPGVAGLFVDFPTGGGGISGCGIVNLHGQSHGSLVSGNATVTSLTTFAAVGWGVGDAVLPWSGGPSTTPAVPPGTTVTAINPGASTLTMSNPSAYTGPNAGADLLWRLPAAVAFSVTTTVGSPTVTVTGGPFLMRTGDLVWSDAFPLGTTVRGVVGTTVGSQTLTMGDVYLSGSTVNATVTHAAGSGKLWLLPAAIHQNIPFNKDHNYMAYFFAGEQKSCADWTSPGTGCSADISNGNGMAFNVIGRYNSGNNGTPGISQSDIFGYNSFSDIVDATQLGDIYIGDVLNSAEAQTSLYNLMGSCVYNFPTYIQVYQGGPTSPYCMQGNGIGVAPVVGGGGPIFIGAPGNVNTGASLIYNGLLVGPWTFNGGPGFACFGNPSYIIQFTGGNDCTVAWQLSATTGLLKWGWFGSVGGSPMWWTEGGAGSYPGYTTTSWSANPNMVFVDFHQGFLLYDAESFSVSPGPERLVDEGATIPAAPFHKQGDVHFNQSAVPGGYAGWVDTGAGAAFRPFGAVANDVAGTSWPVGKPVAIAALVACGAGMVGFGVVTNGVAVGAAGYGAAVSATGSVTRPVFCDGASWTYH